MIPTTALLDLLHTVIHVDDIRNNPGRIRDASWLEEFDDFDPRSFATLARIASGEAWEGEFASERIPVPAELLNPQTLRSLAYLADQARTTTDTTLDAAAVDSLRRLAAYATNHRTPD